MEKIGALNQSKIKFKKTEKFVIFKKALVTVTFDAVSLSLKCQFVNLDGIGKLSTLLNKKC
jgi:hypothetical protein